MALTGTNVGQGTSSTVSDSAMKGKAIKKFSKTRCTAWNCIGRTDNGKGMPGSQTVAMSSDNFIHGRGAQAMRRTTCSTRPDNMPCCRCRTARDTLAMWQRLVCTNAKFWVPWHMPHTYTLPHLLQAKSAVYTRHMQQRCCVKVACSMYSRCKDARYCKGGVSKLTHCVL